MSVQGYSSLNGIVSNPYAQAQASAIAPIGVNQDNLAQNTILTGTQPLASAVMPAQQQVAQQIATSQATAVPMPTPQPMQNPNQNLQLAQNPPAPQGCGGQIDCNA